MSEFIEAYPLSNLNQKDIKNLHRSVIGSKIKRIIKSAITENIPGPQIESPNQYEQKEKC